MRRLSNEEICSAYDMPLEYRKVYEKRKVLPFLNEISSKILLEIGKRVLLSWKEQPGVEA